MTTGSTLEKTRLNIREAIEGHLETLKEFGDPIPQPSSRTEEVEVTAAQVYGRASGDWAGEGGRGSAVVFGPSPRLMREAELSLPVGESLLSV
jgi:hypothetical protein